MISSASRPNRAAANRKGVWPARISLLTEACQMKRVDTMAPSKYPEKEKTQRKRVWFERQPRLNGYGVFPLISYPRIAKEYGVDQLSTGLLTPPLGRGISRQAGT